MKAKPKVIFVCPVCGALKLTQMAWLKRVKRPTCSRRCNGVIQGREWAKHGHKGRASWSEESNRRQKERMRGPNHFNWKGGRTTVGNGYQMIWMPEHPDANSRGYVWEHRYVMEQMIGRRLLPEEVVHHVDENPSNNEPSNLRLHESNNAHLAIEHKVHDAIVAEDRKRGSTDLIPPTT